MLHAFIDENQTNWDILLSTAEFMYHKSINHFTVYTPFFLNMDQYSYILATFLVHTNSNVAIIHDYLDQQSIAILFA
jgi:hypothetical protein